MGCLPNFIAIRAKPLRRRRLRGPNTNNNINPGEDDCHQVVVADGVLISKYSWEGIEKATANFSEMIGSGGFSTVYMAVAAEAGAVKVHHDPSDHLRRIFKQELDVLIRLNHPNIVRLLGFCDDDHENGGALVLEYMPNGSLQEKLHDDDHGVVLPWRKRVAIALQLAQALEYLHDKCIVHGDIKSSNVLLDHNLDCKLCDFGSAKVGFSSAVAAVDGSRRLMKMVGSPGYTDPHYLRTGMASKKNDIYSYGVILLELVTGMEAFSQERNLPLTSILGSSLTSTTRSSSSSIVDDVVVVVDPRMQITKSKGSEDLGQVRTMLSLAALCLSHSPTSRPSAAQISRAIHDMSPSAIYLSSSSPPHKNERLSPSPSL